MEVVFIFKKKIKAAEITWILDIIVLKIRNEEHVGFVSPTNRCFFQWIPSVQLHTCVIVTTVTNTVHSFSHLYCALYFSNDCWININQTSCRYFTLKACGCLSFNVKYLYRELFYILIRAAFCWRCWGKQTDLSCRCVWELHPCSISGLWAVVCSVCVSSVSFLFAFWLLSFLSLLPPCRVLLRTSCCLVITVWLSPSSLWLSVLLKSPAASTALQPPLPPPVSLCRGSALLSFFFFCLFFGVILWVHLLFVDLLSFFWLLDTPTPPPHLPLPAVRSPMVQCCACLQFCGWSVGSQSCSCEAVSVSSMLWLVFRVDHVHKALQLPGLTPTHPHIQNVKCHVEVMLLCDDFPSGKYSVWGVSYYAPDRTQSEMVSLTVEEIKVKRITTR